MKLISTFELQLTVIHPKAPEQPPRQEHSNSVHDSVEDEDAVVPHTVIEPKVSHVRVNSHSAEFQSPQIHHAGAAAKSAITSGGASGYQFDKIWRIDETN